LFFVTEYGPMARKVIPPLQAEGHEVIAAQYGLDTNEGDVAMVKRALGRVSSPAILVGHSYGGSVITAAGTDDRVAGLVYISAVAPDAGETTQSQLDKFRRPTFSLTLTLAPTRSRSGAEQASAAVSNGSGSKASKADATGVASG
jgi:pimeloyl-ACP methyl ester carboxylesterase